MMFVTAIPIVGQIMILVWAFTGNNESRKNYYRATLATFLLFITSLVFLLKLARNFEPDLLSQLAARIEQPSAITEVTKLENLLESEKCSLLVNVNTASSEELQSLPNIGPSKAEIIISNRPYQSVDELVKLQGISQRILDKMRPNIKTDGKTEKIQPAK